MIKNMREKGMRIRSIARELNISRNSVRKFLDSEPSGKQERKSLKNPSLDSSHT